MIRWLCGIGCGVVVLVSSAQGQQRSVDSVLTWPECLSLTLRNNPELDASRISVEASESSYKESRNGLSPQVNLDQSYGSPSGSRDSKWTTVGAVNVNLWNRSEYAAIKTAKTLISQAQANLRATSTLVRFNLRRAFAQSVFAQKDIEASRRILDMRMEESQLVTLRYNSGRESKGNMLRANAQLLQAQANAAQSVRNLRTAQRNLNRHMGLEEFVAFRVDSVPDSRPPPELPKDERALLNRRSDIELQENVVATNEAILDQARSSYWPDLSVGYSQFLYGFKQLDYGWNILLSYPLFGRGLTRNRYSVSTAKSNVEKARQNLRSASAQALVDIETSWSEYVGSFEQAGVQRALLEAARQRNEEANIRYNSGLLTYDNWEIIVSDRIAQERESILAQLNVANAEAAWERDLGEELKAEAR
jgi:outer membrane protein TolC